MEPRRRQAKLVRRPCDHAGWLGLRVLSQNCPANTRSCQPVRAWHTNYGRPDWTAWCAIESAVGYIDPLVWLVAVLATELDEFSGFVEHDAARWGAGDVDPEAASEIEEPLVA